MKILKITILLSILLLVSCKKKTTPIDFHYEYFPMEQGTFVIYDVQDIIHDDAVNVHDTSNYQLKTVIGQDYIDNQGRTAKEFLRYTRPNSSAPWQFSDLWTAYRDADRLEIIEENERIIRLVFAVSNNKMWNPNAYNSMNDEEFYYDDLNITKIINGQSFEKTVVVEEKDETDNKIHFQRRFEVYAEGVGLVRRHYKDFTNVFADTLQPLKGFEQYYTVVSYGVE